MKGGFSKGASRGTRRASHPRRRGASRRASRSREGGLREGGLLKGGFKGGFSGASKGLREGGLLKGASRRGGGSSRFSRRGGFEAPLLEAPSKPL